MTRKNISSLQLRDNSTIKLNTK